MIRPHLVPALALLAALALPSARAEDAPPASAGQHVIDMAGYRAEPAAVGPRLSVPPDLILSGHESEHGDVWRLDEGATWLPFEEPRHEAQVIGIDTLVEVLRSILATGDTPADAVQIDGTQERVTIHGSAEAVQAVREHVPWALAGLAPSVRVDAVLTATRAGETRLRAMGGMRVWPGRWTRVYLQADEVACVPIWNIEVAQEATTTDPVPVGVVEGRELYVRYHPGESVSLVEVWAGEVEHLEILRHDLSGIRNVPEANGFGRVSYPRSAVNRAYTQLLLPAGRAAERTLRWTHEGATSRLALRIGASPAPAPVLARAARHGMALLRTGAVSAGLDFGTRPDGQDAWVERLSARLFRAAERHEAEGRASGFGVSPVDRGGVLLVDAPTGELEGARAMIRAREQTLAARTVHLRVLTAPEAPWREASLAGRVVVGRPVPPEVLAALRDAGAVAGASLSLPVLVGIPQGFRVGCSVPGVIDYDGQLAQQAAGLHPVTSARFRGLFGEVRVRAAAGGHAVRLRGNYCWADNDSGAVELTVRPPVSMEGARGDVRERPADGRVVRLPLLTGGHAPIGREVELATGSARDVLVHAHVRGDEVVLVLLSLE